MENKYNKSQIFSNAWFILSRGAFKGDTKITFNNFSEALKYSWSQANFNANPTNQIQNFKNQMLNYGSFSQSGKLASEMIYATKNFAERNNNKFIVDVATSVLKYKSISEKQAFVLARFYQAI